MFFFTGRRSVEYYFPEQGTSNSTAVFPQRLVQKGHAVEDGSRLLELKGQMEVMPSGAARGYGMSGAIGCGGAS